MRVNPCDGRCRSCGGELEIIDADDATMTVRCSCGEEYLVETDAFDGQQTLPIGEIAQAIVGEESDRGDQARKMLWRQDHA